MQENNWEGDVSLFRQQRVEVYQWQYMYYLSEFVYNIIFSRLYRVVQKSGTLFNDVNIHTCNAI